MSLIDIFVSFTSKTLNKFSLNKPFSSKIPFMTLKEKLNPLRKEVTLVGAIIITLTGTSYFQNKENNWVKETKRSLLNGINHFIANISSCSFYFIKEKNKKIFKKIFNIEQFKAFKRIDKSSMYLLNTLNKMTNNKEIIPYGFIVESKNKPSETNEDTSSFPGQIMTFTGPRSEKTNHERTNMVIDISSKNFEKIFCHTDDRNPLLIMYYERNCFMCFLIRPFINTLAQKLEKLSPIRFARANIDEIAINTGSLHISATPTFVMYYGKDKFIKWNEYKPGEIIDLLFREIEDDNQNDIKKIYNELKGLEKKIYTRFRLFGLVLTWKIYLVEMTTLLSSERSCNEVHIEKFKELQEITTKFLENLETDLSDETEQQNIDNEGEWMKNIELKSSFIEEIFTKCIFEDMERSDTLEENIDYMKRELKEIMVDYDILVGIMKRSN
ncbi:hypothetical protein RS030_213428 [Cryptosporidium xiaoi]|uniref:Thioredoxin domain-containing protein n=1 Tax=Cryptosporidium xiaoi TaxID=659607 RepID=A0AAV9XXD1_9CRYT